MESSTASAAPPAGARPAQRPAQHAGARPAPRPSGAPLAPRGRSAARVVVALMLREMASKYGRSPGGYLWAVLEPVAGIVILSVAFSLVLRQPPLGTVFVLFYATGMVPFTTYGRVSNAVGGSVRYSRELLAYPRVTWVDALLARFALNALLSLTVGLIVLGGVLLLYDTRSILDAPVIAAAMGLTLAVGLGVGALNCYLGTAFPLWENLWSIANRPLFLASGVFFTYDDLPEAAQSVLWYNPLIHVVGLMRAGFYPTYSASYVSPAYVIGLSLVALFFGLLLLRRFHREALER